jgi:hypothetical protein
MRSPKGLIGVTRERWNGQGHDPKIAINKCLESWRTIACDTIEACGRDPAKYRKIARASDELDCAYTAALLLKQLDRIEAYLDRFERTGQGAWPAIEQALILAACVHRLDIVDNEPAIAGDISRRSILKHHLEKRRARRSRWQAKAKAIRERHPTWSTSDVARRIYDTVEPDDKPKKGGWNTIRRAIEK